MSESDLSGRQISGGGSSPNSSLRTSARDVMSQHSMDGRSTLRLGKKRTANVRRSSASVQSGRRLLDQGQLMTHADGSTAIEQVFGVLAWTAVADQFGGGPGTVVAVTVTSGVGLNPSAIPFPAK